MTSNTLSIGNAIASVAILGATYLIASAIFNAYFHPLSKFPGPPLMRISRLPYIWRFTRGVLPHHMLELHNKYGDIVRIAPDELAFADPQAWNDVHGHRTKGQAMFEKSPNFNKPVKSTVTDIINADREEHGKLRRTLAHGFSDKSLREQQPMIRGYVDLLTQRLRENCDGGKRALDITSWYNFATFDIIGDLAFGEPFGCLEQSAYHDWVSNIFRLAKIGTIIQSLVFYPAIKTLLDLSLPLLEAMTDQKKNLLSLSATKLETRMKKYEGRPDLVEPLLKRKDEWGLTMEKLQANTSILVMAGSETTATQLSGVTYYLVTNPAAMARLTAEIRSTFAAEADIDFTSTADLQYMNACLQESFRLYPPVAQGLPRVVPPGGASVCGHFLPGGNIVAIHHYASYRAASNFKDPGAFRPERWLGDEAFADDRRDVVQPFQVGPRNCIGRNLAWVEMRTTLARMLFNFDFKLDDRSRNWTHQGNFNFWDKPPLYVYLSPVTRGT